MAETKPAICRFCGFLCGVLVDVEERRAVKVTGDPDNPMYQGYCCAKGRALPQLLAHPERLLHPHKRTPRGFEPIPSEQALDEIAAQLARLVERHGPRSVALYFGTHSYNSVTFAVAGAFMEALGSPMSFTNGTIDQPGKAIAAALHGLWMGGAPVFDDSDTWLLVGINPLVSLLGGVPGANPSLRLSRALARGMKLIAIDPRRSETARRAHIHIQPRPGEDPTILAGMIRVILAEGLEDRAFLAENVRGLEALRAAVEPFTPEYVERRAAVPRAQLVEAARTFARGRRGCVTAGTGPNMAPRGTLLEYLVLALDTLCGRWLRTGERLPNPSVLIPQPLRKAQAIPPVPGWGYEPKLRVRGLGNAACGLQVAALPEEILLEGEGQVRALINVGGNPALTWPDPDKTQRALAALELQVSLDPFVSATAEQAHYVIAPRLALETPLMTNMIEGFSFAAVGLGYPAPYGQYSPAIVDPPAGSDLLEEWEFFWGLARRMGLELRIRSGGITPVPGHVPETVPLPMDRKPNMDEIFEITARGSRVPLDEVKRHPHGALFPAELRVQPRDPGCNARLELGNGFMLAELGEVAREDFEPAERAGFRLISRRMPHVFNSHGRSLDKLMRARAYNPAFMNPADLERLGLAPGDLVEIRSRHGSIVGVVERDPDVRPGVVSMAHGFGAPPGIDADPRAVGASTGRLASLDEADRWSAIPRMSAIPIEIRRAD
jgi:anaerobic selenocysteine-containing dehydrogenase